MKPFDSIKRACVFAAEFAAFLALVAVLAIAMLFAGAIHLDPTDGPDPSPSPLPDGRRKFRRFWRHAQECRDCMGRETDEGPSALCETGFELLREDMRERGGGDGDGD